jgi:NADH dehydrogenase [ubiquinone] 1 alpha subcomplex assembly factor 5
LSARASQRTSAGMPELFDMSLRSKRRDRAKRGRPELFLLERAFDDCLERLSLLERRFDQALLIGCADPQWPERLAPFASHVEVRDPGDLFSRSAGGQLIIEDRWDPREQDFDLVLAVGTLDTVNDLPLAFQLIRHSMNEHSLFLAAMSGGDTLPQLRAAMRAADAVAGGVAPHVHPRIEASALASLLADAGFANPVVDIDRVTVAYSSLDRLVDDLRRMGSTNMLNARARFVGRAARKEAIDAFRAAGDGSRTREIFEILHLATWTGKKDEGALTLPR